LLFVYFKIARIHIKEEACTSLWKIQHGIVAFVAVVIYFYAFNHWAWYVVLLISLLSFVFAGMLIAAVQLGIFVDGKPLFGMKDVYKNSSYFVLILCALSAIVWVR